MMSNMLTINAGTSLSFNDVKNGQWFASAIAEVSKQGIYLGYTDGSFKPNQNITREELAHLLVNIMKWHVNQTGSSYAPATESITSQFKDSGKIANWASDSMALAVTNGLMQGSPDGNLNPKGSTTREEAAVMFYRLWQWMQQ